MSKLDVFYYTLVSLLRLTESQNKFHARNDQGDAAKGARSDDMKQTEREIAAVLAFWFEDLLPSQWFEVDALVDAACRDRFVELYERLALRVPQEWLGTADGCLAAVIVLDQFPRNMFRNDPRAFATDHAALAIVEDAVKKGFDDQLEPERRMFLYMPFQHSEDATVQARSVELFTRLGTPEPLESAKRHKAIIDRFDRFPHRNEILGRPPTEEEGAFLDTPGSSF